MLNKFYNTELARLRVNSLEFAKANPAIAPSLGATSTDPDIELLLQGVAFLNGLTLQKLEDEFPEIAQELAAVLAPQLLRPMPAATMIAFVPKVGLNESVQIAAGTEVASGRLDGVSCLFRTTGTVHAEPLRLDHVEFVQSTDGQYSLRLTLVGVDTGIGSKLPNSIRFYLGDEISIACEFLMLLRHHVTSVRLSDDSGQGVRLSSKLLFPGFDEPLIPYPDNAFPGFALVQELLHFPQKFLFVEFSDIAKGKGVLTGNKIFLDLQLDKSVSSRPPVSQSSFLLNVVPAVNLFKKAAEPIRLDYELTEHPVVPDSVHKDQYQIYSIDSVIGLKPGNNQHKHYVPFALLQFAQDSQQHSYRTTIKPSLSTERLDTFITVVHRPDDQISNETLSIRLTCTNRGLPERLKLGELNQSTDTSPERFSFGNISPITGAVDPAHGEKLLWDVVGHMVLNLSSLQKVTNLRALLKIYNSARNQEHTVKALNERQIEGIIDIKLKPESRLHRGVSINGQHICLQCDESKWAGKGSLYLWGCVLSDFLASYAGVNSYTRFELVDQTTGTNFKWPLKLGQKPLL
jgi:type VI secretion system protein ImpG